MRAQGNGDVTVCAENLLRLFRGEVPYERVKGLDPRMIDRPTEEVIATEQHDVWWLLETYEPRTQVEAVDIEPADIISGGLRITALIKGGKEVTNG